MRDRGVDRDHEIERRDGAGGLGEIRELRREVDQVGGKRLALSCADLQAEEAHALYGEEWRQHRKRDCTIDIVEVFGAAGPDDADLEPLPLPHGRGKTRRGLLLGVKVRDGGRDGVERRAQKVRQAQQRALHIRRGQVFALGDELEPGHGLGDQRAQGFLHMEHDLGAALAQERQIAAEM